MTDKFTLVLDDAEVKACLEEIRRRASDLTEPLRLISNHARAAVMENFEKQGAYSSPDSIIGGDKKWKPLSQVTIDNRKARRLSKKDEKDKILRASGALMQTITRYSDSESAEVRAGVEYAAMQHFGAKKGSMGPQELLIRKHQRKTESGGTTEVREHRRKVKMPLADIPARPFMTIHPDAIEDMKDMLANYLLGADKK